MARLEIIKALVMVLVTIKQNKNAKRIWQSVALLEIEIKRVLNQDRLTNKKICKAISGLKNYLDYLVMMLQLSNLKAQLNLSLDNRRGLRKSF